MDGNQEPGAHCKRFLYSLEGDHAVTAEDRAGAVSVDKKTNLSVK